MPVRMYRVPRSPRIHYHGAIYHAMSRGVDGREIFHDDGDRATFLRMLAQTKRAHAFHLFAYCLMGNHFHLLLEIEDSPLYSSMHHLLTRYSLYFNRRHLRQGHLFQSRYTAPNCRRDSYLENLLRYIHLNPVRAGLVDDPADWPWSGHRGLIGPSDDPLLDKGALAELRGQSIEALRTDYVTSLAAPPDIQGELAQEDLQLPESRINFETPSLQTLAATVARNLGIELDDLCGAHRGKQYTRAKLAFIDKASRCGHRLTAISEVLGCSPAAVTLMRKRKS